MKLAYIGQCHVLLIYNYTVKDEIFACAQFGKFRQLITLTKITCANIKLQMLYIMGRSEIRKN